MMTNERPDDCDPLVFRGVPDDLSSLDNPGLDNPGLDKAGLADHDDRPVVDMAGLRRRVLAAGVVTLGLFVSIAYLLTTLGVNDGYVLLAVVLIYVLVTRPLMKPVREMTKLRRRLAYQAFLEGQEPDESPK